MDKIKEVTEELLDDHVDDHVDEEIQRCFLKEDPKCFFVFAGAGSGKTRSLIKTLTFLDETLGDWLLTNRKQLALRLHRFLAWKFVMECSLRSSGCLTSAFAVSRSIFSAANCCISSVMWEYVFRVVALDT